jgi:uncharacterized protein YqjF (DUF2071 family)
MTHTIAQPLFLADWCEMFFVHFAVDADALQRSVPFELDLYDGRAYISLVAFTQKNLRPAFGGGIARALVKPLAEHEFLNLRTYVRVGETRGIYFISEWIPNRLAELVGPMTYGLPYRLGRLNYDNAPHRCTGSVRARNVALDYLANPHGAAAQAAAGELEHFLLERYVAFTHRGSVTRRFDVQHESWTYQSAAIRRLDTNIVTVALPGLETVRATSAQFSTGVRDVKIGWPIIGGKSVSAER